MKAINRSGTTAYNVRNTYGMFREASAFNQPLNDWRVDNVPQNHMFYGAGHSTSRSTTGGSTLTNMRWMFHSASSFNQPLNDWRVDKLEPYLRSLGLR